MSPASGAIGGASVISISLSRLACSGVLSLITWPSSATSSSAEVVCGGFGGRTGTISGTGESAVADVLLLNELEAGNGGKGWSRSFSWAIGSFPEACPFPSGAGLSFEAFSLDCRVTIFGCAAAVCSEYGVPPIVSSGTSFNSPVLDSAALFSAFTAGVGCRLRFGCSTLAFFGGTAGSLTSGFFASSCAPQQPSNDKNFGTPRFFGLSAPDATCKLGPVFSCSVKAGPLILSFDRRMLPRLPLRRFSLMLSFEPFLETLFGSVIIPWARGEEKGWDCKFDEVRTGTPGPGF